MNPDPGVHADRPIRIQTRAARVIADKNRELEKVHDELERASRAEIGHLERVTSLGEMTAAVAHELNQPLAAILTNAQLTAASVPADGDDAEELEATVSDITLGARRGEERGLVVIFELPIQRNRSGDPSPSTDSQGGEQVVVHGPRGHTWADSRRLRN